jgi:hypothetical protein
VRDAHLHAASAGCVANQRSSQCWAGNSEAGLVSQIVLDTLEGLKMTYPKTTEARRQELQLIRKQLEK